MSRAVPISLGERRPAFTGHVAKSLYKSVIGPNSSGLARIAAVHAQAQANDALIYLQARKLGCTVLTGNLKDFDCLNQLVPEGRVLLYRKAP